MKRYVKSNFEYLPTTIYEVILYDKSGEIDSIQQFRNMSEVDEYIDMLTDDSEYGYIVSQELYSKLTVTSYDFDAQEEHILKEISFE
mgnify:CR=1 FL=1